MEKETNLEKETSKKAGSLGEKLGDTIFRGVMYLLYGKKAGETTIEKASRVGVIILLITVLAIVFSTVKSTFFP